MTTDYMGTLSKIPARDITSLTVVANSPKRQRGKVRGNARQPRTRTVALSDCLVYKSREDADAGKVSRTIARGASRGTIANANRERAKAEALVDRLNAAAPALRRAADLARIDYGGE